MFRQGPYGWKMYCKQGLHMWGNSLESWNSCFTNAYLAYKYFQSSDLVHTTFKMALSEQLVHYQQVTETHPRQSLMNVLAPEYNSHVPVKLDHPKPCRHGFAISECKTTTFQCDPAKFLCTRAPISTQTAGICISHTDFLPKEGQRSSYLFTDFHFAHPIWSLVWRREVKGTLICRFYVLFSDKFINIFVHLKID